MALSIVKPDARGVFRPIAQEDLYLDESQTKIIVVKDGEEVPKEAAFVLAAKGGTIPTRYTDMLKALETPPEVKVEAPEAKVEPEPKPVKGKSKPETPKAETTEEKPTE